MDLVFNSVQLAIDVAALAAARGAKQPARAFGPLVVALLSAGVLPILMQLDLFHLLRLWSFSTFVHLPLLLVGGGWLLGRSAPRLRAACWLGSASLLLIAVYAFAIEPTRLELTTVELTSDRLERPLRIAVIADLQTDRIGSHERRAFEQVAAARPDLVLMPGDFIQEADPRRRARLIEELRELLREIELDAPLGIWAVRGNCDPEGWTRIFDGLPVTPLDETATVELDGLTLTGLGLWPSFDTTLHVPRSERFHIVFGHAPDFALGDVEADLLVAGHTHGGQVRLPFVGPLVTFSRVPRAWSAGVTPLSGGRTLVVSRGIGMERFHAPRLRFLCRPQVVLIDVRPV